ncbi:hypothetical protein P691DRAFT_770160 [Macrolepiota fuliginosa MF-IS2]|uniref:RAVE complex protein Rav1 C-terminal domain-containing protein n=1 Tax=Macrolepiota fuliginosa MF-IS2 TaxID=1400762 RepID=A0A9P5XP94_9AGAR|nr:hypothetical protein P691DRAFT_770160 [Macrolepiota fuliginosa MF-IS2]
MLTTLDALSPSPARPISFLPLPADVLLLYASADTTVILNARTLTLVRVLAFWEAFPNFKHTRDVISAMSVDPGLKLVVVAMNSRIAAWSLSGVQHDTWRIHSTLILPPGQSVSTLDSRSGLLAVGTDNGLSVYNSILENDLPTWSQKWSIRCPAPSLVAFAPSLMYIATVPKNSNIVRIYSTTSGRQTQAITHPRPVLNLSWRHSQASSRDDLILYTITSDSALRIFLPVLDSPRTLQLHACLDLFSSIPFSSASAYPNTSAVFWLDRAQIDTTFQHLLKTHTGTDDPQIRLIKDVVEEKWDLFLRVLADGSLVLSAVANIDRRPPTLLQQFTLQYAPPNTLPTDPSPSHIYILPSPDPSKLTFITSSPLRAYDLSPIGFFSPVLPKSGSPVEPYGTVKSLADASTSAASGLELVAKGMNRVKNEEKEIVRFVRTSEGHGVGVIRAGRVGEVWRLADWGEERGRLVHAGNFEDTDFVVVLDQGYSFATYSSTNNLLTLHTKTHPPSTLSVPKLESLFTYPTPTSTAAYTTNTLYSSFTSESIFGITSDFYIIHVRIKAKTGALVLHSRDQLPILPKLPSTTNGCANTAASSSSSSSEELRTPTDATPEPSLSGPASVTQSTTGSSVKKIIPIDPMAWGWGWEEWDEYRRSSADMRSPPVSPFLSRSKSKSRVRFDVAIENVNVNGSGRSGRGGWEDHDVLLSVSEGGELAFWVPEVYASANANGGSGKGSGNDGGGQSGSGWRCLRRVRTERKGFNRARCSSAKKTALVVPSLEGDELTIWDSKESEFASGLEYRGTFEQSILDLDWNSTPDMQSILAVGFSHHVEILCQQRMTYFGEGPGWALCHRIDISGFTPYSIADSIWLSHGSFLVGSGYQMIMYGEPKLLRRKKQTQKQLGQPEPEGEKESESESLFEYVARQNGPLADYHPQMVLQCLLWGKVELVKEIIVNLARAVKAHDMSEWHPLPVESFLEHDTDSRASKVAAPKQQYNLLFANDSNSSMSDGPEEEQGFSRALVENLLEELETNPLPHLTPNEQAHLLVLIQATLEIDEQRRALDANGLRYLISMRSFYILNQRAASPSSPSSNRGEGGTLPRQQTGVRERLRYGDMIWAFHSESQELLVSACTAACNGKMTWADARALGVPIWLNSLDSLKSQLEVIARNEYMAGENRDPVACSLFYFALGKSKLVHGLWRQAAWHKEQSVMLKFLSNNFNQQKWKTAALKNAFALLGKRRFEYAAAFFLLGGSLKDAVNVCVRQLNDFQLAVALARVAEQSNEGPILKDILRNTVLPIAFQTGNRWLSSWAFWLLHRRDLAVRILLTPLQDIAAAYNIIVEEIGEPHYDDPSLALLFSQLRSTTLQAIKGTSEISGRSEFNFVLQMARVFCRMGCHVLALDLVRSWSFERPSTAMHRKAPEEESPTMMDVGKISLPPSPTVTRRPMFPLEPALRRRSSIKIDMDILSLPPTRSASPERVDGNAEKRLSPVVSTVPVIKEESDLFARKAGLGNLMKSAKQDVQVPEFDMNAFF